ncbi:MAG: helix-turn-helix domain-containing protein [Bacteroidota bacterium]
MIYIAGLTIALFIAALLLNKKQKSSSDLFLFAWMLLLAGHLYLYYINFADTFRAPVLLGLEIPLPLIHGVMLYYYVAAVTDQVPKQKWLLWLHLLPISIGYLYLIPILTSSPAQKIAFYQNDFLNYRGFMQFGLGLIFVSGVAYVIWCSFLLRRHKRNIRDQFSDIEKVTLSWLQLLIYGLGGVWTIVIFTNNDAYIFLGVTIFVILIGLFGVQQQSIFTQPQVALPSDEKLKINPASGKKKYARSGLKDEVADGIYQELIRLFTEEAYFKKNELSLQELALGLDILPNHLSQIINEKSGQNFYDFVNAYRLEEFKRLVKDPQNKAFTLLALAYEAGFNSKSSFNRYFKKQVGQTPSAYVKAMQVSS